jgi:hypothetical protein
MLVGALKLLVVHLSVELTKLEPGQVHLLADRGSFSSWSSYRGCGLGFRSGRQAAGPEPGWSTPTRWLL